MKGASRQVPVEVDGLVIVVLILQAIRFHVESGFQDSGLVLLRHVDLVMLLKTRDRVSLVEGLVLGPFLGELLGETCETALRLNGHGPSGLLQGSWS